MDPSAEASALVCPPSAHLNHLNGDLLNTGLPEQGLWTKASENFPLSLWTQSAGVTFRSPLLHCCDSHWQETHPLGPGRHDEHYSNKPRP